MSLARFRFFVLFALLLETTSSNPTERWPLDVEAFDETNKNVVTDLYTTKRISTELVQDLMEADEKEGLQNQVGEDSSRFAINSSDMEDVKETLPLNLSFKSTTSENTSTTTPLQDDLSTTEVTKLSSLVSSDASPTKSQDSSSTSPTTLKLTTISVNPLPTFKPPQKFPVTFWDAIVKLINTTGQKLEQVLSYFGKLFHRLF